MMQPIRLRHCELQQLSKDGYRKMIAWVPEEMAVVDKVLSLDEEAWPWRVTAVYEATILKPRRSTSQLARGHRRATGDEP